MKKYVSKLQPFPDDKCYSLILWKKLQIIRKLADFDGQIKISNKLYMKSGFKKFNWSQIKRAILMEWNLMNS